MRNLDNFRQELESGKAKKLKSNGLHLSKKYIPSAKTLYTEELSSITLNYLFESSPNSLCHFWNHKSFFMTQLFCTFLAETLNAIQKSSTSKCRFPDLSLLSLKFTKLVMSFLKSRAFSSNFASLSSVMRDNSSVLFHLKLYKPWTKGTHQVEFFRLSTAPIKINQIPCQLSSHKSVFA